MLIFQALGSFEKYFNKNIDKERIDKIIKEMIEYVSIRENEILRISQ